MQEERRQGIRQARTGQSSEQGLSQRDHSPRCRHRRDNAPTERKTIIEMRGRVGRIDGVGDLLSGNRAGRVGARKNAVSEHDGAEGTFERVNHRLGLPEPKGPGEPLTERGASA